METIYEFLKKCKTFYLATVEGDQPRVRPFGAVDFFEGKVYFQTGKIKPVSRQLHANPKFEICAYDGEAWIRIAGEAVEDPRIEAQTHMLEANPSLKRMYAAGDGNTEVYYFKNGQAVISSFTSAPVTIDF